MKRTSAFLALAALFLILPNAGADPAQARAELAKDKVAFTPEAFLNEVAAGNVKHVELFLEGGIDPSVKNPAKKTALWLAVESQNLEMLKALLAGGVAPNEANAPSGDYGKTLVFAAVDTGDAAYVRALVEAGADAKQANDYGMPPLAEAARVGNVEMCEALLKGGADANAKAGGYSLLFGPVNEDRIEVVKLLLKAGNKVGEDKAALLENAKSPAMRELLEKAE